MREPDVGGSSEHLPPCTMANSPFMGVPFDDMPTLYHDTVSKVIDAHLSAVGSIATTPLTCTANTYRALVKPSKELTELAEKLPEWGTTRTEELSEVDLAPVLLEYLRVYECAIEERSSFLGLIIVDERGRTTEENGVVRKTLSRSDLNAEQERQSAVIARELTVSRITLERTLSFLGGIDRLRPLSVELECLKRTSLDLRNTLGLASEAMSCMPKMLDARGSLRDLPTQ